MAGQQARQQVFLVLFILLWPVAKARKANAMLACSHIAGRRLAGCKDNDNHQAAAQECAMGIDTWCGGFHGTLHCNVSQIAQKDDTNHGIYKYYAYLCSGFPLRRNPRHDRKRSVFALSFIRNSPKFSRRREQSQNASACRISTPDKGISIFD